MPYRTAAAAIWTTPRCLAMLLCCVLCGPPGAAALDSEQQVLPADYLSANGLLNRGFYDLAATEYRRFLSQNGRHEKAAEARYGLAVCLFKLEQYEEATRELRALAKREQFVYAADVLALLGQCHFAGEEYTQASSAFQDLIQRFGDHDLADDAAALAVEAVYREGDYQGALTASRLFLQRWPKNPLRERVEFFQAMATMKRLEYAAAAKLLEAFIETFTSSASVPQATLLAAQCHHQSDALEQAALQYRRVVSQGDDRFVPDALYGLGVMMHQRDQAKEAIKFFNQLLERYPETSLRQSSLVHLGSSWFKLQDYVRALQAFARIPPTDSAHGDQVCFWTAKCYVKRKEFAKAVAVLQKARDLHGHSELAPEMTYDLGVAHWKAGQVSPAIEVLQTFRAQYPDHALAADALYLLSVAEHQKKDYERSQEHCRAFLQRHADHPVAAEVAYLAGENDYLAGRYAEAAAAFEQFLKRYPQQVQSTRARYRLGMSWYQLQDFGRALTLLQKVEAADPAYGLKDYVLGDIHFRRQAWPQAQHHLTLYLQGGADQASADEAVLKLGLAYLRQEQPQRAAAQFKDLLDRFASSPHRLQALFELGQSLLALDRPEEAAKAFEQVLATGADSRFAAHAANHLGGIELQRENHAQAARYYQRAASAGQQTDVVATAMFQRAQALLSSEHHEQARSSFAEFAERFPDHPQAPAAHAQIVICLSRQQQHGEVIKKVDALERDGFSKLDSSQAETMLYEKAWAYRKLEDSKQAQRTYRDLIGRQPTPNMQMHAIIELAELESEAGRRREALDLLKELQTLLQRQKGPHDAQLVEHAAYRKGVCLYELAEYAAAAEALAAFIKQHERSELLGPACYFCAEAYSKAGQHGRAVQYFRKLVNEFPSSAMAGPALLRLGESHAVLQQWTHSAEVLEQYLQAYPDADLWFQARFGVAWARENQGRFDEAIQAYQDVVQRHQGVTAARAQFQIGQCLFAKQEYTPAVVELLKVDILYAYPEWRAAALFEAGRCLQRLGRTREAQEQFKRVTQEFKDTTWAKLAAQQLAQRDP